MQSISPRVVLAGLDPALEVELSLALHALCVEVLDWRETSMKELEADFVFCGPPSVEAERLNRPRVPVIAVSQRQCVAEWLDAMEAGASDYCAAPFESVSLDWIIRSGARSSVHRAA